MEKLQSLDNNLNESHKDRPYHYFTSAESLGVSLDQNMADINSNSNFKRRYQDLLKKFRELKRDQQDTFTIHADSVIKLQDKIKEKDLLLKRAQGCRGDDAWSDSELEMNDKFVRNRMGQKTKGSKRDIRLTEKLHASVEVDKKESKAVINILSSDQSQVPSDQSQVPSDQSQVPVESIHKKQNVDDVEHAKLVEVLKTKIDFMKKSYEETSRYYCILQERDKKTILQLSCKVQSLTLKLESSSNQVSTLTLKLESSSNQVSTLTQTSEKLKKKWERLLKGLNETQQNFEKQKQEYDDQLQELREIYVSETQSGIQKNAKINELQTSINDKNREIHILRGWLGRIKRDLRNREFNQSVI